MKAISARNIFDGTVVEINGGPVTTEVTIETGDQARVVASITSTSAQALGVRLGQPAVAIVKAPLVTLIGDDTGYRFSARNQFSGVVESVSDGAVNSVVTVKVGAQQHVSATVTNVSASAMSLAPGSRVIALFKASHVVLGVRS